MSMKSLTNWTRHISTVAIALVLSLTLAATPAWASSAVGMVETRGFPAAVEAADQMVKAGRVALVAYEKIGDGRVTVIVRGDISEVQASVSAGAESAKRVNGGQVLSTLVIARPHEKLDDVLPIASK